MQKEFLEDIGDYEYVARREYAQSIDKVIDEPVDIFCWEPYIKCGFNK